VLDDDHGVPSAEGRAALAEWKELLEGGDLDAMVRTAARRVLDLAAPAVRLVSEEISRPALDVTLVSRCVVKRAFDAVEAILLLTESGYAYNALALLRPTCEDLFFIGWLLSLPRGGAHRYLVEKAQLEIKQGIRAQEQFFPEMRERFDREVRPVDEATIAKLTTDIAEHRRVLKDLGRELGWDATPPRVKSMAEVANAVPEYEFLYSAASSSVHASLHHLLRMVWGDPVEDVFSVNNDKLERHYSRFGVIYGTWLLAAIIERAGSELPPLAKAQESDAYGIWLATLLVPTFEHDAPGIVTREELHWDGPPLPGA
jgi:hypothetical protein